MTTTYTVRRTVSGTVTMSSGREEPATRAHIYADGRYVTSVSLNACTLCLPGGSVYGLDATDAQVITAVLGDEDIFTGAPAFPEHHDTAIGERLEYLRGELRAERISYGELAELQGLASYIEEGDTELLEAAGVPEHAGQED